MTEMDPCLAFKSIKDGRECLAAFKSLAVYALHVREELIWLEELTSFVASKIFEDMPLVATLLL